MKHVQDYKESLKSNSRTIISFEILKNDDDIVLLEEVNYNSMNVGH